MPTSSDSLSLTARGLGKRYVLGESRTLGLFGRPKPREEIWALRDVDLDVEPGEVLGLVGPNGAGKTTLLKVLARITEPTTGRFTFRGRTASLLEIGTGFHHELTGRENVYLAGTILGMRKAEIDRRFDEIVAYAGLERFLDTPIKRYSAGMYVRLAFSVAAHLEAEILLIDEVLAVGDQAFRQKCVGTMRDVAKRGRTILFVSHDLGAIQRLCTRALLLDEGRIQADGAPPEVVGRYLQSGSVPAYRADTRTGRSQILSVELVDGDGRPLARPRASDPFGVKVGYALPDAVPGATLEVSVLGPDGTPLLSTNTQDAGFVLPTAAGKHQARVVFPADLLLPGEFHAGVILRDAAADDLDRREPALAFHLDPGASTTPESLVPRRGLLHARGTWS